MSCCKNVGPVPVGTTSSRRLSEEIWMKGGGHFGPPKVVPASYLQQMSRKNSKKRSQSPL